MITSKYDWQLASPSADEAFLALAKKAGLEASVATLLYERGIQTKEDLEDFLEPKLEKLHDPYLLHDMDKAVERIRRAIEDYEQILIYGDYDADGMTSASIMKETLEQMGAEVQVYLPNRFTDGYGPNESVYEYFIVHICNNNIPLNQRVDHPLIASSFSSFFCSDCFHRFFQIRSCRNECRCYCASN